jgi:precorrin-2 dehydrogenase/sirohydrochlorin ferrochelatase
VTHYYPIVLKLSGKLCIVIGGGNVAERKVKSLLECGARVRVVSPQLTSQLREWANKGKIELKPDKYEPEDLDGAFLVISATDQEDVNESVSAECFRRDIPVNVVDVPAKANFFVPSTIRRGPLSISISTNGKSPLMAKLIREDLESLYGPEFGDFLEYLGNVRDQIIKNINDPKRRHKILSTLADRETIRLLREGHLEQAKERINNVYCSCGDQS